MSYLNKIELIIWDWNGTLLNDVDVCVESMNKLLTARNLKMIDNAFYKQTFTFPVKDYYEKIGFDFSLEPFEIPAIQFMDLYRTHIFEAGLHSDSISVLSELKSLGYKQAILSAMEENLLNRLLDHYKIADFFDFTFGIDNHYGAGKIGRGKELIQKMQLNPAECLLVGDTLHDAQVADEIGCQCLLFDDGHQSRHRLEESGKEIISRLSNIFQL